MRYVYPVKLDKGEGTVLARFRDLPEAVTEGPDRATALVAAAACLDAALRFRLKDGEPIPSPSEPKRGEILVPASPRVAAKAAFIAAFARSGLSRVALGAHLGLHEGEVRRMLDPVRATKLDRLDTALRALGRRLVITDEAA